MFSSTSRTIPSFGDKAFHQPVTVATLVALPACTYTLTQKLIANANGALPNISGVACGVGTRILVRAEAGNPARHGIYIVTDAGSAGTPWILTRATDANKASQLNEGAMVMSMQGDPLSNHMTWVQGNVVNTLNDNQRWDPFTLRPYTAFYRLAGGNIANNGALITWDNQWYGDPTWLTVPGTTITIPAGFDGVYHVNAGIPFNPNATGNRGIYIQLNGTNQAANLVPGFAGNSNGVSTAIDLLLSAGDTVRAFAFQNSGGPLAISGLFLPFISLHWLGIP